MKIRSRLSEIRKNKGDSFIDDRRCTKRYDIPLKLNYCDPITKCQGESLAKNISRTGLRFPVNTKILKGTMLDLKIEDPHSTASIISRAKVIWIGEFIAGDDAEDVIYEVGVRLLKKWLY